MGRGILSGLIWGSMLSIMLVWVASQMGGMIEVMQAPEGVAMSVPDPVEVEPLDEEVAALAPTPESPVEEPAIDVTTPDSVDADAAPVVEADPGQAPEASDAAAELEEPEAGEAPSVTVTNDQPVRPAGASEAPEAGSADAAPQVAELAPAPDFLQPVVVEPTPPVVSDTSTAALPEVDPVPQPGADSVSPTAPDADDRPEIGSAPAAPEPEPVPEPAPAPEAAPVPKAPEAAPVIAANDQREVEREELFVVALVATVVGAEDRLGEGVGGVGSGRE